MPPDPDPFARERLFEHADFLRRLARGLLADEQRAEDLVQDTWVAALSRPPRERGSPRAWLATVARHLAANDRRRESRRQAREQRAARPEREPAHDETLARLEVLRGVFDHVLELREPYRTAVYLRYYEDLGPQAIAMRLGVPVKTVKTRLARAREELRRSLDERPGGRDAWMAGLAPFAWPRGAPTVAATLSTWLGGTLLVKKLAFAALALLVALVAWRGLSGGVARSAGEPRRAAQWIGLRGVDSDRGPIALAPAPPARAPRVPLPARVSAAPPTTGDLLVELVWQDDGSAVAGLCLDALCLDDPEPRRERTHVVTGEDGSARYQALPAGRVRLFLSTGFAESAEVVAGEAREVRVEVPAGYAVEGLVVDPDGGPVADAEVWVQHGGNPEWNHRVARSHAGGRFRLHGLSGDVAFGARARGWQPSLGFEAPELPVGPRGAREVTLELRPPGGGVAGRVLDPDGAPVREAHVLLGPRGGWNHDLPSGLRAIEPRPVRLTTDADGAFSHPSDLASGAQPVHVSARGYPVWTGEVRVDQGARAWLEVRLERAVRVTGRVVDGDGVAVGGAEVVASRERGVEVRSDPFPVVRATTDAQGLFLLDWVAPGEQELVARVPSRDRLGRARASLSCAPGEERQVELVLVLGSTIRGRVVDREGRPLASWDVFGESTGWVADREPGTFRSLNLQRSDRTDGEGRFVLANLVTEGLRMDAGMHVQVAAPGELPVPPRAEARGVRPGTDDLELVVENTRREPALLRGRLVDAVGGVPQDVSVTVWDEAGTTGLFAALEPRTGAFEHASTLPGRYTVRVLRGGNTLASSGPHELTAGETTDVGLLMLGSPGRVEVRVRGVPADELGRLRLALTSPRAADEVLELDGERFRSRLVAASTWTLRVQSEPWFVADREVEVLEGRTTELEVEAVPGFEVDLAFELSDAEAPWSRVEVEIRDEQDRLVRRGGPWPPARARGGLLKLHGLALPAGSFTVTARTDRGHQGFGRLLISDPLSARGPHRFALR